MDRYEYAQAIEDLKIVQFGFDTHARALKISKDEVKKHWNHVKNGTFKRFPRTEYVMRYLPELSTKFRPFWRLETPEKYLMFYLTPTAPIVIPDGLITDLGSIPLLFQNLVSIYDRELLLAFLVHDVECEMQRMSRFTTDGMIYEVGEEMNTNWLRKNIVYTAVRAGNRYGKKDKVVRGFNVSKYNRELIAAADKHFLRKYYPKHILALDSLSV